MNEYDFLIEKHLQEDSEEELVAWMQEQTNGD